MARWHRGLSVGVVVAAFSACSSDTTYTAECPPELIDEGACFLAINVTMAAKVRQWRSDIATACANIAQDLGQAPPEVTGEESPEEVRDLCEMATSAVDAARDADPTLDVELQYGDCASDDAAEAVCGEDHAEGSVCWHTCLAEAHAAASCDPITVTVTASDPALAETLEDNVPALVRAFYYADIMAAVGSHVLDASMKLDPRAGCEADIEEGARLLAEWMGGVEAVIGVGVTFFSSSIWR